MLHTVTTTDSDTPTLPFSTASDAEISALLSQCRIGLTVEEARKVSALLQRDPTIVEAVIWGIQGSEHCSYKSSRRFLRTFLTEGKHIILGPVEDSGIVAITDGPPGKRWGFVVTHESHNHPSQIVPFEGAATGVGGTVRDIVCMGARVIGCMDMLRLGDLKTEESKTIAREVVRGIGGYGNPLGVPNLGGDTVFDSSYNSNCLVNAVALGIVREDEIIHSYVPKEAGREGYDIILVGKPTDRSGFGGAAFASASMEEEKQEQNTGAVQEPNPFLERHLLASSYALFDWLAASKKLDKVSCKDLGAGGVVCASVEQIADQGLGATVRLEDVHVALQGLPPEVIACAETQERLCWICHPELTDHIITHYNEVWDLPSVAENARASVIGKVNESDTYTLTYHGQTLCEATATAITCGLQYERATEEFPYTGNEPAIHSEGDTITVGGTSLTLSEMFRAMLAHPNGASKAPAFRHFDKNVIGNTLIEPGEADAAVIAPLQDLESYVHEGVHPGWELSDEEQWRGVAVAADGNGRYGRISPYWQGVNAVAESMRNVAAVGGKPRALTDCLNYGNPEIPTQLWALSEGVRGIADAAKNVQVEGEPVPVISGNVSLYNGRPDGSAIDPTAIVSCIGILRDAREAVSMTIKEADSLLFLIGERKNECGGSLYYQVLEERTGAKAGSMLGANVPQPDFRELSSQIAVVTNAIEQGIVLSSHDISDGGLLMTLFEMTLPQRKTGGKIGIAADIGTITYTLTPAEALLSQTGGFVLEIHPSNAEKLHKLAAAYDVSVVQIGKTRAESVLSIESAGKTLFKEEISSLRGIWENGMKTAW
ncbi:phosphoribosylformylglycinamidine synthase subunit PurL [Candidatus Peregrinibacteria bacterium CG10_big_fil_rev_8_21_14_0_10_49_24]|nr:MAG: phosphoribosylformylglycinamidine synthase subunit PurL [Candidatus Peregrinibacteria bacterium CG11_big_fil_rev_8_21_14_0_20_49_14]PIR51044.1 MAG: phosphoribosylformylglycinamidine synthase subunit PurL [Candidatus Peregrinibacteria bacterium CG10_big_fil_rev_8_21_14_0_10_49_24]PJA67597.1 MAG: phosphoribosylformylglycinamidine synthase subunit PurL [Candidatus Peregrinibacteria bacterium CG_4_9_14_3_um_filter_49_12]